MKNLISRLLEKENLLLAGLPVAALGVAYIYELGHASELGYSRMVIKLDLLLTIRALTLTLCLILPALFLSYYGYKQVQIMNVRLAIFATTTFAAICVPKFLQIIVIWQHLFQIVAAVSCWGYFAAMLEHHKRGSERSQVICALHRFSMIALIVLGYFVVFACGKVSAHRIEQYSVFEAEGASYVLVAYFGELGVGIKFESNEILSGDAIFIELAGLKTSEMISKNVKIKRKEGEL